MKEPERLDPATMEKHGLGLSARLVALFLTSKLSFLLLVGSIAAGAAALGTIPREEEPQIIVPVVDVTARWTGALPDEMTRRVVEPIEARLSEIDGVENLYARAEPGLAVVRVRFLVGRDLERSLVKVMAKKPAIERDLPAGATIDLAPVLLEDVPILTVALVPKEDRIADLAMARIAAEVRSRLVPVPDVGRIEIFGARARAIRIEPDLEALAALSIDPARLFEIVRAQTELGSVGSGTGTGRTLTLYVGDRLASRDAVAAMPIPLPSGKDPRGVDARLDTLARVTDGPDEPTVYHRVTERPAGAAVGAPMATRHAVTLAIAKRKGSNAVVVAQNLIERLGSLRGTVIPESVETVVTRNDGATADHKAQELVRHLMIAVVVIVILLTALLGPKEAFVVALAVPMTLAITLVFDGLFGYSINRVTLFALILSLGLLVDDPIVDVENIVRHLGLRRMPPLLATLFAVDEVRPPTILATLTVIVSFLPMMGITGMMGPYMAPMAFNVPIAMAVSLAVAFTVTPWATYKLLGSDPGAAAVVHAHPASTTSPDAATGTLVGRVYRRVMSPLLRSRALGRTVLGLTLLATLGAFALPVFRLVPLKMLPFDDKDEFRILVETRTGTSVEETDRIAGAFSALLAKTDGVVRVEAYSGRSAPIDFNGLVRGYGSRVGSNLAELRVALRPAGTRPKSHAFVLALRPALEDLARAERVKIRLVESPPGPPVMASVVAELRSPSSDPPERLRAVAEDVVRRLAAIPGTSDVDHLQGDPHERIHFHVDAPRAAAHGLTPDRIGASVAALAGDRTAGFLQAGDEPNPVPIRFGLGRSSRTRIPLLEGLSIPAGSGRVTLSELGTFEVTAEPGPIFRKDGRRVAFVAAETPGTTPLEAVIAWNAAVASDPLPAGYTVSLSGEGEWKITLDVFRDLGIAFAVALVGIYLILVGQTASLLVPLVIMAAIPLTAIGIMPGFYLLNRFFTTPVGVYPDPIYFTATAMIGMIALAGIVVRNSIILIDFIETRRAEGRDLVTAILESGAVRFRPILLTAGAAVGGAAVITLDPIFSGLAWSFIFGIIASTAFTMVVIPLIYHGLFAKEETT